MIFKGKTVLFDNPPVITASAGVAGKKEGEGPLRNEFDEVFDDTTMGQESFEQAESALLKNAVIRALTKANKSAADVDFIMTGDLLDQCTGSCFALKDLEIAFIGMYGACSTMALTLCNSAMLIDAGARCCVAGASSHFASSERQFRYPLEYGGQRPPTSQWTVTGAGAAVVVKNGSGPKIKAIHIGTITDLGIKDANNMGAAMAPAAADTLKTHFSDLSRSPDYYDVIFTGDLGIFGHELCAHLLSNDGITMPKTFSDCGKIIFSEKQKVFMGGSGAGCSSAVFASYLFELLRKNEIKKLLLVPTGALLNKDSPLQKQSIPGIAHAVSIEV